MNSKNLEFGVLKKMSFCFNFSINTVSQLRCDTHQLESGRRGRSRIVLDKYQKKQKQQKTINCSGTSDVH